MLAAVLPFLSLLALWAPPAQALSLTLRSEESPYPGLTIRQYRTSSPTTNTWVALADLCTDYVHVEASRVSSSTRSTGSWAEDQGVQLATNGDFYKTSPLRVYGDAVGGGVPWPLDQTGRDSDYSDEWYYGDYGWIAFGPDWVEFTHSGWQKNNPSAYGADQGWAPTTLRPDPPDGTIALVSGFPELVIEGAQYTCSSATASDCFPDRSDMRDRHPRTAMGITEDKSTFILAVVDGRTDDSAGMYGAELADLMAQLGAWEAFNLDGGGSSQFWLDSDGYLNDYDGNNSGSGLRSIANHWGIYAGEGSGRPRRPGHCMSAEPCGILPPEGGILDDEGDCFKEFGAPETWRVVEGGHDGRLLWTNAFESDDPDNWAWWRLFFEQGGSYSVEVWAETDYSIYDAVRYEILAGGSLQETVIDPSGVTGWVSLGTYEFVEGGEQYVAVYDNYEGDIASSQRISADAIRLQRLDPYCGDGLCDKDERCADCPDDCPKEKEIPDNGLDDDCDGEVDEAPGEDDTGSSPDDDDPDDELDSSAVAAPGEQVSLKDEGCACAGSRGTSIPPSAWLLSLLLLRRRRSPLP